MGRPKSVILTPQELKAALGTNNARLKELRAQAKVYEGDRAKALKAFDKAVKAAEAIRDAAIKAADKAEKAADKEIEALEAKNAKLKPAPAETPTS